ncbi:MAG: hypothetical protein A2X81_10565 [Desulfobacterales bacterium GWB2_56_26]|nr:MAG: hypothetical protein A2X81_10565 [Desulfobacterales bacterium GWB2_56_26]
MKFRRASLIFLISLGMVVTACDHEKNTAEEKLQSLPTAEVTVSKATKRAAARQVEVVGTVQAVDRAEISAKITGNIIALPVDLGSSVKQGELLVELSAGEISAQVQQAKAQLEQAKRNLLREENLLKKNAATPESVKSLQDSVRIAEAAHRETHTMLDYARITAPFAGIVTRKFANTGDLATPGKPLLILEEGSNLQVLTDIPEAMIAGIMKGNRLKVTVPSVDLITKGTVAEISPTADPTSRTAPVKLHLPADDRLRSGQFARVGLVLAETETLTVPTEAVVPFGQMERIFVVDDGRAKLRLVRTGAKEERDVEILSGLTENEVVIVTGNGTLTDGQPVSIRQ